MSEHPTNSPVKLDFKKTRDDRRKANIEGVFDNEGHLREDTYNPNKLDMLVDVLPINRTSLLKLCKRIDVVKKLVAFSIAKDSSRQGSRDELLQIEVINDVCVPLGLRCNNLGKNAVRAVKGTSDLVYNKPAKNTLHKSFDAELRDRANNIKGYLAMKVLLGKGGHQDNVMHEITDICQWYIDSKHAWNLYAIIDTDNPRIMNAIQSKFGHVKGIYIMDHYDMQKYIIESGGHIS